MSEDEVEIEPDDEEYEVVPLSPIRKLEKRIDELEEKKDVGNAKGVFNEVLDLVKANQRMVEEMVKSNSELRRELEKLPGKIDKVTEQWDEFLDILKRGEEEQKQASGVSKELSGEMKKLVELNENLIKKNEEMVESMRSMKRSIRGNVGGGKKNPKVRVKKNSEESRSEKNRPKQGRRKSGSNPRVKIKDRDGKESR